MLSTEELRRTGQFLLSLAGAADSSSEPFVVPLQDRSNDTPAGKVYRSDLRAWTKAEYDRRRARDVLFSGHLMREPAWDILLDLFVSHLDEQSVRVTSACIASCVPSTTALRWLTALEDEGLLDRRPDTDGRASLISLSARGVKLMTEFVSAMIQQRKPDSGAGRP